MKHSLEEIKAMLEVIPQGEWSFEDNEIASTIIRDLLVENDRLSSLAARHLADQELLVGRERRRVARECIDYVNNHASDCGCSKRIAHDIRARYGVEG